jgi:hypothetical protein
VTLGLEYRGGYVVGWEIGGKGFILKGMKKKPAGSIAPKTSNDHFSG